MTVDNVRLRLPEQYRTNDVASADAHGTPYWADPTLNDLRYQAPVYRLTARRARELGARVVADVGCGSGDKLHRFFGSSGATVVGIDQGSGIALARSRYPDMTWRSGDLDDDAFWRDVAKLRPDVTLCSDVIEHLADPEALLRHLRQLVGTGLLILSTPDRSRLEAPPLGPPRNPRHVREWTAGELAALVTSQGFRIVRHHHRLPRSYSLTQREVKRCVWRALHFLPVPDPRSCQVLELRAG